MGSNDKGGKNPSILVAKLNEISTKLPSSIMLRNPKVVQLQNKNENHRYQIGSDLMTVVYKMLLEK